MFFCVHGFLYHLRFDATDCVVVKNKRRIILHKKFIARCMADETKQLNNRKNATHVVLFAVLIAPTLLNVSTDNNAKANGISMKNCTHTVKREQGTKQKRILRTTLLRAILSSTTSEWNQNETNYISDNNNDRSMLNGKISTEKPILLISRINHSKRHISIPALWKLLHLFYPENVSIASKYNWRRKMLSFCYWAPKPTEGMLFLCESLEIRLILFTAHSTR